MKSIYAKGPTINECTGILHEFSAVISYSFSRIYSQNLEKININIDIIYILLYLKAHTSIDVPRTLNEVALPYSLTRKFDTPGTLLWSALWGPNIE